MDRPSTDALSLATKALATVLKRRGQNEAARLRRLLERERRAHERTRAEYADFKSKARQRTRAEYAESGYDPDEHTYFEQCSRCRKWETNDYSVYDFAEITQTQRKDGFLLPKRVLYCDSCTELLGGYDRLPKSNWHERFVDMMGSALFEYDPDFCVPSAPPSTWSTETYSRNFAACLIQCWWWWLKHGDGAGTYLSGYGREVSNEQYLGRRILGLGEGGREGVR